MLLYDHRDHKDYYGLGAQDGYLDFHTVPELLHCCFTTTDTGRIIRDEEPLTATSTITLVRGPDSYSTAPDRYIHTLVNMLFQTEFTDPRRVSGAE